MNTTVVVVCALVIALFTASCSKDNAFQMLRKMLYRRSTTLLETIKVTWLLLMGQQQQSGRESIGL